MVWPNPTVVKVSCMPHDNRLFFVCIQQQLKLAQLILFFEKIVFMRADLGCRMQSVECRMSVEVF